MAKRFVIVILVLVCLIGLLQFASAEPTLAVDKTPVADVVISELNEPAAFDFVIDNNGEGDSFQIYSLLDLSMHPKGLFYLPTGKTKMEVTIYPGKEFKENPGALIFEYQLRGEVSGIFKDTLMIYIASLKDSLQVSSDNILPDDKEINVKIKNLKKAYINDLNVHFESEFFDFYENVSLEPLEEKSFKVPLDSENSKGLLAGVYPMVAIVKAGKVKEKIEGNINYLERKGVAVNRTSSGFLVREHTTTKTNVGNVPTEVEIEESRDIATRLLTGYSINPAVSDRSGFVVDYNWKKELQPGEAYSITSTTNYTFPFIMIILVVVAGFLTRFYVRKAPVNLVKRVSLVRTKGGEFALKIRVNVHAKDNVSNLNLTDYIPAATKLYGSIGHKPNVGENARMLSWNVGNLNSGEERMFSYIVYSNLKVVGRFELPLASASYDKGGSKEHVLSNKTYFIADSVSIEQ